jgi:hypothetical protein
MAINRSLGHEVELAAAAEVTYGTDAGTVAAGDFFKHQAGPDAIKRVIARLDRDKDARYLSASVITTQKGRESCSWAIPLDVVPSGSGTPTEPDIDILLEALFGSKHKATAHTTTTSGSTTTSIVLTAGGGAASGLQIGDFFALDVDAVYGYEVRQVSNLVTDTITPDRAFSAAPATGRAVKVGTTYRLAVGTIKSFTLKEFIGGSTRKRKATGCIVQDCEIKIDSSQDTPAATMQLSGVGKAEETLTDTRPTPTTAGIPLVPSSSKVWFGTTKLQFAGPSSLKFNNALELRENESGALTPTGPKRTANGGNYRTSMALALLGTTGDEDTFALYDAAQSLTAQDVLVQLGILPGNILAWRCPVFKPEPDLTQLDGEVGINFGGGRCYALSADDEVALGFL